MEKKIYMAPQSVVIYVEMSPYCILPTSTPVDSSASTSHPLSRDNACFFDSDDSGSNNSNTSERE